MRPWCSSSSTRSRPPSRQAIGDRLSKVMDVQLRLPAAGRPARGLCRARTARVKPWGTSHAVLSAPGRDRRPVRRDQRRRLLRPGGASSEIYDYLRSQPGQGRHAMNTPWSAICWSNTVTENGHVARGICEDGRGRLPRTASPSAPTSKRRAADARYHRGRRRHLDGRCPGGTIVSMNMWGFTAQLPDGGRGAALPRFWTMR